MVETKTPEEPSEMNQNKEAEPYTEENIDMYIRYSYELYSRILRARGPTVAIKNYNANVDMTGFGETLGNSLSLQQWSSAVFEKVHLSFYQWLVHDCPYTDHKAETNLPRQLRVI